MTIFLRLIAWLLAAAVTFATLGPPGSRPHSDLGQNGEHALAFVLVGLAFGLAHSRRRWSTAAISVVLIGVLEILQLWAPGRHARLEDFVVDALAACAGFVISAVLDWTVARSRAVT
jgi:VanZ family protein